MEEISCIKDGVTGVCRDLKDKTARASVEEVNTKLKGIEDKITDVAKLNTYTFTNYADMLSKLKEYVDSGKEEKVTLIVKQMSCNTSRYIFSGYDITNGEHTWYTVNTPSTSTVTIWGRFKMVYNPEPFQYAFQKISAYMHTAPYTYGNDCETIFVKNTGTYYKKDTNSVTDNTNAVLKKSTDTTEFHQIYNYSSFVENYTLEIEEAS